MDSYCVIHFKEKQERVKILNFLASETQSKFIVTNDLKEYVFEAFHLELQVERVIVKEKKRENPVEIDSINNNIANIPPTTDIEPQIDSKNVATVAIQQIEEHPAVNNIVVDIPPTTDIAPHIDRKNVTTVANQQIEEHSTVNNIVDVVQPTIDVAPQVDRKSATTVAKHQINENREPATTSDAQQQSASLPSCSTAHKEVKCLSKSSEAPTIKMDDIGTFVPYRERMIEPKQEEIDDEELQVVAVNYRQSKNTEPALEDIDRREEDVVMEIDSETLTGRSRKRARSTFDSGATPIRRSVRITERMTDPVRLVTRHVSEKPKVVRVDKKKEQKSKKPDTPGEVKVPKNCGETCQKCGTASIKGDMRKIAHASVHAKIDRFECSVNGCDVKSNYDSNIGSHIKMSHAGESAKVNKIKLSVEQVDGLNEMIKECFVEGNTIKDDDLCHACNVIIPINKRQHAINHTDIMIYKCAVMGCQYATKMSVNMINHDRRVHEKEPNVLMSKIELSKKEEQEIEKMFKKCFPTKK